MKRFALMALACLIPSPAFAQEEPGKPAGAEAAKPGAAADAKEADGIEVIGAYWYRVTLTSGENIIGLTRLEGEFERPKIGGGWAPCEADDADAGMRLWYVRRQDGYVFVKASQLDGTPRRLGPATADDARKISEAKERARKRAAEERERVQKKLDELKARLKGNSGSKDKGEGDAEEPLLTPQEAGLDEAQLKLLTDFPPGEEWSLETPEKIQHRKVVMGLFPTVEQKRFLATFDDWKAAYEAWQAAIAKRLEELAEEEAQAEADAEDGDEGGDAGGDEEKPEKSEPPEKDGGSRGE